MPETLQEDPLAEPPILRVKRGILVVASPDSIPEAAFSIPAIRTLHPQNSIVVLANQTTAPLWRKVAEVNRVIEHSGQSHRKIARILVESKISFQASIAWEDSPAARAFALLKIPQRLGYSSEKLRKYLTHPVEVVRPEGPIEHRVRHYLLFTKELGMDPFQASHFTPPMRQPVDKHSPIAIAPGSDFGSAAEWPLERFQELLGLFPKGRKLAILASPDRPGPAAELAKSLHQSVIDIEGEALIDFLSSCRALLANDGSLPHLASFVGTPSLVLFGPNEPEWRRPLGQIHEMIREHVPCSGCLLHKCPLDHRCMNDITPEDVHERFMALLKKT